LLNQVGGAKSVGVSKRGMIANLRKDALPATPWEKKPSYSPQRAFEPSGEKRNPTAMSASKAGGEYCGHKKIIRWWATTPTGLSKKGFCDPKICGRRQKDS